MRLGLLLPILCLVSATGLAAAPATGSPAPAAVPAKAAAPAVWIIAGLPGDAEREAKYLELVAGFRDTLGKQCGVAPADLHILFGQGNADAKLPACTRESLLAALDEVRKSAASGRPTWVFLFGHAKSNGDNAFFHVSGPDVSFKEIAARLKPTDPGPQPLAFVAATAAAGKFIPLLAVPGRAVLAASLPEADDNEPELPAQLLAALRNPSNDARKSRRITLAELFTSSKSRLAAWYEDQGYELTEFGCLDGNGDGIATRGPYKTDQAGAEAYSLPLCELPPVPVITDADGNTFELDL